MKTASYNNHVTLSLSSSLLFENSCRVQQLASSVRHQRLFPNGKSLNRFGSSGCILFDRTTSNAAVSLRKEMYRNFFADVRQPSELNPLPVSSQSTSDLHDNSAVVENTTDKSTSVDTVTSNVKNIFTNSDISQEKYKQTGTSINDHQDDSKRKRPNSLKDQLKSQKPSRVDRKIEVEQVVLHQVIGTKMHTAMVDAPIQIHVPVLNRSLNGSAVASVENRNSTVNGETKASSTADEKIVEVEENIDILEQLQRQQQLRHANDKKSANGVTGKKDSSSSKQSRGAKSTSSSSEADRKKRFTMPLIYRLYESQSEDLRGTIRAPDDDDFHPEDASKALRKALSGGIQSDDKVVINVLLSHNNYQRQKIAAAYEGMYSRRLAEDIEEEAGGFFLDAVLALIQPAHLYSTRLLHYAISGRSHSRSIAVEIALTSTASQLKVIRDTYQTEYRVSLERDLSVKVEGLFGRMLMQLLMRNKNLDSDVDVELADREVEALFASENNGGGGVEEIGRNLDLFNRLFGQQGLNQVRTFLERYDANVLWNAANNGGGSTTDAARGRDFESLIRKNVNIHSDIRQMILLFVRISRNMQLYFAEKLHEAISGARPDHASIIRVLVSRSEIDLTDICDEYKRKYGHHIVFDLQSTCSGDFLRLLYQLVNPYDLRTTSGCAVCNNDDVFAEE